MRSRKPKICFVGLRSLSVLAPEYGHHGNGGEEVQHALLARALNKRGYDVSIIVSDYGQDDGQSWSGVTTYKAYKPDEGIPIVRFVYPRWTKVWSALRRANADIYYVSCAGMMLGQVAMFCRVYQRRLVFRIALNSDCEPDNLPIKHTRDKWLYRYGLARADTILAQTQHQQERLRKNFGRDSKVATMLVDEPDDIKSYSGRDIDMLWVSNLRAIKRPDLAVDLAETMPHRQFHIVGGRYPTEPRLYDEISSRAEKLPNVTFHGQVPYSQVHELYDRAKVFVNTSDLEGFPNTYLQAWVRGTPVVALFDPDDIIERKRLGNGVKDLAEMRNMVEQYLQAEHSWHEASQRCLQYMRQEYNPDKILEPYISTFDALMDGKPSGQALKSSAVKVKP